MSKPSLDLASFNNAISQLEQGLTDARANAANHLMRDGVIQRFEYMYEQSWKILKRFLELTDPRIENIDTLTFPALIRTGWEKGLTRNSWDVWEKYRNHRNAASHTYNEKKAEAVYAAIPDFLDEARFLLKELQQRVKKS